MTTHTDESGNADGAGFSASWLTLREPADHTARSTRLSDALARWCGPRRPVHVVELGAGTGSNFRYLAPGLGHEQRWRLVDHDAALLEQLPVLLQPWIARHDASLSMADGLIHIKNSDFSASISTEVADLATQLERLPLSNVDVLAASALLDLTSAAWLDKLAKLIVDNRCACLFALNYNGHIDWHPGQANDAIVTELLNQHQTGDKGFGPALGPGAGSYIATALENAGRSVDTEQTPWVLDETSMPLQQAIIDGWAPAAEEQDSSKSALISQWHAERQNCIEKNNSTLTVGHIDVLSLI